ncbi:hypothetical protein HWV62_7003 [Athelia sp. TMB]|nr:hypothetical protein HWV62_7003 [Athelia sp. TMB]
MSALDEPQVPPIDNKKSRFGTFLTRSLPEYTGPLPVGVRDIELPVPRQTFGAFQHAKMPGQHASLVMDSVLFSVFYPCDDGGGGAKQVWFPKFEQTIDGLLGMAKRTPKFAYKVLAYPLVAAAIYGTTLPARANAPLRPPSPSAVPSAESDTPDPSPRAEDTDSTARWPLMLFSHGVGGSRQKYSHFCGEMASRGWVCAAIEHRDGTSPESVVLLGQDKDAKTHAGGRERLDWLDWGDLHWPHLDAQPTDDTTLRHEQLRMRVAEAHAVLSALRGEREGGVDQPGWDGLHTHVDARRPVVAGHSLGGSAAQLLAAADPRFDVRAVVAFDPAAQRILPWSAPLAAPVLVLGSEEFTHSADFRALRAVVPHAADHMVLSIVGTTHAAFTDAALILPAYLNRRTGLRVDPGRFWAVCVDAVGAFLGGDAAFVARQATRVGAQGQGGGEEGEGEGEGSAARRGRAREGGLERGTFVVHDL